jgi:hypothetical protein
VSRQFQPGHSIRGGRPAGVRNKLHAGFLADLQREWEQHGAAVVKILRTCHPVEFARLIAGTLPKEFVVESTLAEIGDDELDAMIERMRAQLRAEGKQPILIEGKTIEHEPTGNPAGEDGGNAGESGSRTRAKKNAE